jgi:molybdopterin-guanine dinucleotide biosynthesis protein A
MPEESRDSDLEAEPRFGDVAGVILAGGMSRRYGTNKAFVRIDGLPLIERVSRVMTTLFEDLFLITNTPAEYAHLGLPMYEDLIKGLGPIGGIYTALSSIPHAAAFCVACDMPALNPAFVRHMVLIRDAFEVVVPRIQGKIEALHALYARRCLPHIRELIDSGNRQVFRFFPNVSVRYVEEEEIRRFDPGLRSFLNINRPEERAAVEERIRREKSPSLPLSQTKGG